MFYPTMWLRGNRYRLRRVVPLPLREILGRSEIRRSLRTKDYEEAKRRWKQESLRVDALFEKARRGAVVPASLPRMSEADREITLDYYADKLVAHDQGATYLPAHLRDRYLALVQDDGSPRVSEVLERWITERRPSSKTEAEFRAAWTRMTALALDGRDAPIKSVTKANIRQLKDRLLVAKGRRGEVALSPVTVSKVLAACKTIFQWATNNGLVESNPCVGITVAGAKRGNGDKARLPYDADTLKKLFDVKRKGAANYWLPYLGLYQGARLEELCQLRVEDVKTEPGTGIVYLDIHGRDGRKVKTQSSERKVPLHPELVRLGFLNYVEQQVQPAR